MNAETTIFDELLLPPFKLLSIVDYPKLRDCRYHQHSFFQIVMGWKGTLSFQDPDLRRIDVKVGDVLVIPPGKMHYWEVTDEPCRTMQIQHDTLQVDRYGELALIFSDIKSDWNKISVDRRVYLKLIEDLKTEFFSEHFGRNLIVQARLLELLTLAVRSTLTNSALNKRDEPEAVRRALVYIERHLHEKITLKELAENSFLGISRFSQVFRTYTGFAPGHYINLLRIEKAKVLLRCSQMSVSEVAAFLGFDSIHYFSRLFKKHVGIAPSDFMKC